MMLLELERVCKRFGATAALADVSLVVEQGERVAVWGSRRSGRSTLLRVVGGIEAPDSGRVLFDGADLNDKRSRPLGEELGFFRTEFRHDVGHTVLDQLLAGLYARRVPRQRALTAAGDALRAVGIEDLVHAPVAELRGEERVLLGLARALTGTPRLLLVDDPFQLVESARQTAVADVLASIAREGTAVLSCSSDAVDMSRADRVLSLDRGVLRGASVPELAPLVSLAERRREAG